VAEPTITEEKRWWVLPIAYPSVSCAQALIDLEGGRCRSTALLCPSPKFRVVFGQNWVCASPLKNPFYLHMYKSQTVQKLNLKSESSLLTPLHLKTYDFSTVFMLHGKTLDPTTQVPYIACFVTT
jgi:hypothetical protein